MCFTEYQFSMKFITKIRTVLLLLTYVVVWGRAWDSCSIVGPRDLFPPIAPVGGQLGNELSTLALR